MNHNKHVKRAAPGFTLTEVMATLAIIATVTGLATPLFGKVMGPDAAARANLIVMTTMAARIEAVRRAQPVRVEALDPNDPRNEWGRGMVVYVDHDGSGTLSGGDEKLKSLPAAPGGATIDGPDGSTGFAFLPDGTLSGGNITLSICGPRHSGRKVTMTGPGAIYTAEQRCG